MAPRAEGSMKMDRKRLSPIIRICIDVVESVYANHELVDAAGKLISAEALFNEWVYAQKDETRPNALSEEGFLELLEMHENLGAVVRRLVLAVLPRSGKSLEIACGGTASYT